MSEIHPQLFEFILWPAKSGACRRTFADVFAESSTEHLSGESLVKGIEPS